jgi:hypothetical protein
MRKHVVCGTPSQLLNGFSWNVVAIQSHSILKHTTRVVMSENSLNYGVLPPRFHILPNETLFEIALFLSILKLRRPSKVNKSLCDFVQDYFGASAKAGIARERARIIATPGDRTTIDIFIQ